MTEPIVEKRPKALQDLKEIALYLAERSGTGTLAKRFLAAAETNFEYLVAMPEIGVVRAFQNPELASVRMWPIRGFDEYQVFYRKTERGVEIIRVLHAKRDIKSLFDACD